MKTVSEVGQSRTVKAGSERILVYRTPRQEPDAIKDIKEVLVDLDVEDIRGIDALMLFGSKKSVRVDSSLVEDLVGDRTKPHVVINGMKEELDRNFGFRVYDRGPHKRLAVRLPVEEIKDFAQEHSDRIKEVILESGELAADTIDDIISVYLIADETYVRLEPDTFFAEIFDLKESAGPEKAGPTAEIIMGESPQELVELALNRLKGHDIYRDVPLVEAAGLTYIFNALAVRDDERVLIQYIDSVAADDMVLMKQYMEAFNAGSGWILTRETAQSELTGDEDISIFTMKDL